MGNDELKLLQAKVAELERKNAELAKGTPLEQIKKAARTGRKDATTIRLREFKDYVSMKLYHTDGVNIGKMVGPLHPDNAESTFMRFAAKGTRLSINKPTEAEIEAYKNDPANAALFEKEVKRRDARKRSRKESEVDRLTKSIEKLSGIKSKNFIKSQDQVK